jgi:hypothetical protein
MAAILITSVLTFLYVQRLITTISERNVIMQESFNFHVQHGGYLKGVLNISGITEQNVIKF